MSPPGAASLLAAVAAAAVVSLVLDPSGRAPYAVGGPRSVPGGPGPGAATDPDRPGAVRRHRALLALLAGVGVVLLVGGPTGVVLATAVAAGCWRVAGRVEAPGRRRRREEVGRAAPHVVALVAAALRAGAAPAPALRLVADALPGPATDPGRRVAARLALGADPVLAWQELADEPALAPWGRAMARAHESGAPVVETVERVAADLADAARAEVEDRARTVGVRAALPLGVCLLPSFLLLGIVPLVAGLADQLW